MRIKVSDYIADFLANNNITDVFTVTGGCSMHLNDSFGHHEKLHCTYNHNEQASAMAAEAYARIDNKIAAVCVTAGPGATNAITGALCGYMDSIPMMIFSGQVRYDITVRSSGLPLRTMGIQEFDITKAVNSLTKYAVMVSEPYTIRYHLEKALYLAKNGRPGPVWLDMPLDVQSAIVETDNLQGYQPPQAKPSELSDDIIDTIISKIKSAKRPVLMTGNGIRLSGVHDTFLKLIKQLNIPVVTGMSSIDAIDSYHPLYVGRSGPTGNRAGNFAVQNADLLISIGNRLSFMQIGFNTKSWARNAYKIVNDIDLYELKKPYLSIDMPICCDAARLIKMLYVATYGKTVFNNESWLTQCLIWRSKYPVVTSANYEDRDGLTNIYAFFNELSMVQEDDDLIVVSVGTSRVAGSQAFLLKRGQRFITNPNTASMGYGLPAAIGVCTASGGKNVTCVTGDGSLQMNIQELQTIIHNKLPIKIFIINNNGYHSIRQTQQNYFDDKLIGIGTDSGDISFPKLEKLAPAYGFPYYKCNSSKELRKTIQEVLNSEGPVICEIFVTVRQKTEPKASSKKLNDGRIISAPLEDLAPFLPKEELLENMYIPLLEE